MNNKLPSSSAVHIHYIDHNREDDFGFPMSPPNVSQAPAHITVRKNMFFTLFEDKETNVPITEPKVVSPTRKCKVSGFIPTSKTDTSVSALPYNVISSDSDRQISVAVKNQHLSARSNTDTFKMDSEAPHGGLEDGPSSNSMAKLYEKATKHKGVMRRSSSPSLLETCPEDSTPNLNTITMHERKTQTSLRPASIAEETETVSQTTKSVVTVSESSVSKQTNTLEVIKPNSGTLTRTSSSPSLVSKVSGLFRVPSASDIDTMDKGSILNKAPVTNEGGLLQDMNKKVKVKHRDLNVWGPTSM